MNANVFCNQCHRIPSECGCSGALNAYELAKKLEWYTNYDEFVEAGAMLRQQADRIAELEKRAEPAAWMHKESGQVFAGIGSPMKPNDFIPLYTAPQKYCPSENNAAYEKGVIDGMAKQRQSRVDGIIGQIGDSPIHDLVHRTTPQIKELSDKEIEEIWKQAMDDWTKVDDGTARLANQPFVFFARAILKKASEK